MIINAKFFVLIKLDRNFILVSVEFMSSWSLLSGFSQLLSSYFGSFTLGKKLNEEDMQRTRFNTYSENTNNIFVVSIFTQKNNF